MFIKSQEVSNQCMHAFRSNPYFSYGGVLKTPPPHRDRVKPVMDPEPRSLVSRVIEVVKLLVYIVKNTCLYIYFAIERFFKCITLTNIEACHVG